MQPVVREDADQNASVDEWNQSSVFKSTVAEVQQQNRSVATEGTQRRVPASPDLRGTKWLR